MWQYSQSTGELSLEDELIEVGYSGHERGKNNAICQDIPSIGPIPQGLWTISPPYDTTTHGPVVMRLTPDKDTQTFNRSGFLIHGDNIHTPGAASFGCVILSKATRVRISNSPDKVLKVIK